VRLQLFVPRAHGPEPCCQPPVYRALGLHTGHTQTHVTHHDVLLHLPQAHVPTIAPPPLPTPCEALAACQNCTVRGRPAKLVAQLYMVQGAIHMSMLPTARAVCAQTLKLSCQPPAICNGPWLPHRPSNTRHSVGSCTCRKPTLQATIPVCYHVGLQPQRQLAVAAGGDGTLRVLDVLRSDPLLLLEPDAGGLLAAAWSPSRPLVFAAASGGHGHFWQGGALALLVLQRAISLRQADHGLAPNCCRPDVGCCGTGGK